MASLILVFGFLVMLIKNTIEFGGLVSYPASVT
jgi:hypothetical protein